MQLHPHRWRERARTTCHAVQFLVTLLSATPSSVSPSRHSMRPAMVRRRRGRRGPQLASVEQFSPGLAVRCPNHLCLNPQCWKSMIHARPNLPNLRSSSPPSPSPSEIERRRGRVSDPTRRVRLDAVPHRRFSDSFGQLNFREIAYRNLLTYTTVKPEDVKSLKMTRKLDVLSSRRGTLTWLRGLRAARKPVIRLR